MRRRVVSSRRAAKGSDNTEPKVKVLRHPIREDIDSAARRYPQVRVLRVKMKNIDQFHMCCMHEKYFCLRKCQQHRPTHIGFRKLSHGSSSSADAAGEIT